MKLKKLHLTKFRIAGLAFGLTLLIQAFVPILSADAATLTNTYVRLDRLATGSSGAVRLVFTTVGAGATSASINFSSAWTTNSGSVNTTQSVSSASCAAETGATALPGSISAAGSGSTITISSVTALSATTAYCVDLTSATAVTNPTAGSYSFTVTVGSDSTTVATTIVSSGADQVTVSATVNPTFSLSLSTATDNLGALTTGSVSTSSSAIQATVSTNAANGWNLWSKDSQAGLRSTNASYTVPSNCASGAGTNSTLSAGTEGYNLGAVVNSQGSGSGGTTSVPALFNGSSLGRGAGLCSTNYQTVATSTGTANAAKVDMKNSAAISGVTKPGTDYQDIETFVGAGLF